MRYLMLVCTEPIEDPAGGPDDIERWVETHNASGARVWGDRLAEPAQSRLVRVRASGGTVEPGPLDPAHAALAGIDILECDTLEQAVEVARDHPMARGGVIQVWPFYDWDAEG